jgi:Ser/Thr protein kinase RdoA (MazF antagonist)
MVDNPSDAKRFAGSRLLHTDWHRWNVLVTGEKAWLVDWAWATWGAAFIDPALLVPRLIAAGHTPTQAEAWAETSAAWQEADQEAVTLFSGAAARLLRKLADDDAAGDWRRPMVDAAATWAAYRGAAV